jgi:hypothetical protein
MNIIYSKQVQNFLAKQSKPEYTPYAYLIGWSKLNKWYYGVRYATKSKCLYKTGAHPDDFWKTYFTSSHKQVKPFREQHGEPDVVQIRRCFNNDKDASDWEQKVLKNINASKKEYFFNEKLIKGIRREGKNNGMYGNHTSKYFNVYLIEGKIVKGLEEMVNIFNVSKCKIRNCIKENYRGWKLLGRFSPFKLNEYLEKHPELKGEIDKELSSEISEEFKNLHNKFSEEGKRKLRLSRQKNKEKYKWSEQRKQEWSGRLKKTYSIEGKIFFGKETIAEYYNICLGTVHNRIKNQSKFKDWFALES